MRSQEWLETRVQRARERILTEARGGHLGLHTLFAALGEITDDPPSEHDALLLAEALGCIRAEACSYLIGETRRILAQEVDAGSVRALGRLSRAESGQSARATSSTQGAETSTGGGHFLGLAVVLQALIWAVLPPGKREPWICY